MDKKNLPSTLWMCFFFVWIVWLTGYLPTAPGVKQWFELERLLQRKREQVEAVRVDIDILQQRVYLLKNNKKAQEEEIRQVLGYVKSNEMLVEIEGP